MPGHVLPGMFHLIPVTKLWEADAVDDEESEVQKRQGLICWLDTAVLL